MSDLVTTDQHGHSLIPSDDEINRVFRLARGLQMSGLFKDTRSAEQAFGKILLGQDLGLTATQALTSIDLIEGKPEMSANLQAAKVRQYRSPEGARYDFRVVKINDDGCALRFERIHADGKVDDLGLSTFTKDDAKNAGLTNNTWRKYARNMMFARALTNGVAWFVPEVTFGTRVYGVGEISGREPDQSEIGEAIAEASPAALEASPAEPTDGSPVDAVPVLDGEPVAS